MFKTRDEFYAILDDTILELANHIQINWSNFEKEPQELYQTAIIAGVTTKIQQKGMKYSLFDRPQ